MAKLFLERIGRYWRVGTIMLIVAFFLLLVLGFYLGPDKMMVRPPEEEAQPQFP